MKLTDELEKMKQAALETIPAEITEIMDDATRAVADAGIAENSLGEGATIPSFSLPNAHGETVTSNALLAQGPLVISFYRGDWCPYCNLELRALQERLGEIRAKGATLVAISPETPESSAQTVDKNALEFEVLSDLGNRVAEQFGLVMVLDERLRPIYKEWGADLPARNGDDSFRLPLPGTYVVDRNGTVVKAFVDADYRKRLDPDEVIAALETIAG